VAYSISIPDKDKVKSHVVHLHKGEW
jgi:hypothetical protein